jgi:hypothetical protein
MVVAKCLIKPPSDKPLYGLPYSEGVNSSGLGLLPGALTTITTETSHPCQKNTTMQSVSTPRGNVELLPATAEMISEIRFLLPFGLVSPSKLDGKNYGIVMQCGSKEVRAVKLQPPDTDEKSAMVFYQINSTIIAHSLNRYREHGFGGLMIPCGYLRSKEDGTVESGVACFGFPKQPDQQLLSEAAEPPYDSYDAELGAGFTVMLMAFVRALQASELAVCNRRSPVIGLDVRRRMQLGRLGFGFAVLGSRIICLKTAISSEDQVWTALRLSGIEAVYHLPSVPAGITDAEFALAKFHDH